jgi:hypothetical protein
VNDGVMVGVLLGVNVGVRESVNVAAAKGVAVGVSDGVLVGFLVGVCVAVLFTDGVNVGVDIRVIVALGKAEESRQLGVESTFPYGLRVLPCSSYIFTNFTDGNCLTVAINGRAMLYEVPLN